MMNKIFRKYISIGIVSLILLVSSCAKFVELGSPPNQVSYGDAFKTDASAQSVVLGLYVALTGNNNNANISNMTTLYPGVSADDLVYNAANADVLEFANNGLLNTNVTVANLWSMLYQLIKNTNNAVAGLQQSTTLTSRVQNQLLGEAKFLRAYAYFYLTNLYGDVPLPITEDYRVFENAVLPRTSVDLVYAQIIDDLKDAEDKLDATYRGTFRARVNKHAASALLARVYLYRNDYPNAEVYASKVLGASGYALPAPSAAFLNTSDEVIFQLANLTGVTTFGINYVTGNNVVPGYTISQSVYDRFETTPNVDLRRSDWVLPKTVSERTYYAINKYKAASGTANEYHIVLRLAEQYLIRAEARAKGNDLSGAKADVDAIRSRAGLAALNEGLTQGQLIEAIEQERLLEFFGEYGHRWMDLKRTNRASEVLAPVKPSWQPTDVLYPIPQAQILLNPALTQNTGYEN